MYPLDFEEYLWAMGEDMLIDYIKECFDKKVELERSIHNKAMLLFKQYMIVGGMPKPLIAFIENHKDFVKCDKEKRDILDLYRSDLMKINAQYKSKVLALYDQIPGFLSSHEKRVIFKNIENEENALKKETDSLGDFSDRKVGRLNWNTRKMW